MHLPKSSLIIGEEVKVIVVQQSHELCRGERNLPDVINFIDKKAAGAGGRGSINYYLRATREK